jgi:ABC-type glycerol-3-phosphate transport system permease component
MKPRPLARLAATGVGAVVSLLFLYPYLWMLLGAFRSTSEILAAPLRLWPEH